MFIFNIIRFRSFRPKESYGSHCQSSSTNKSATLPERQPLKRPRPLPLSTRPKSRDRRTNLLLNPSLELNATVLGTQSSHSTLESTHGPRPSTVPGMKYDEPTGSQLVVRSRQRRGGTSREKKPSAFMDRPTSRRLLHGPNRSTPTPHDPLPSRKIDKLKTLKDPTGFRRN